MTSDLFTPEGTRDYLFGECSERREIESKLCGIFKAHGFSEVITPTLEFFDVFNRKKKYFPQEAMYKLVDGKNRLVVIRPDMTVPIARLTAARLKESTFPLKLYYNQDICLSNPKNSGLEDEITQCGVEIIGGEKLRADFEALSLAVEALEVCTGGDFRLEIGNGLFFEELIGKLDADENKAEEIRLAIKTKNAPQLSQALSEFGGNKAVAGLKALPYLFGGGEVFEKASEYFCDGKAAAELDRLKRLWEMLSGMGFGGKISLDFGLVNKRHYYTGIMFRGYAKGVGKPVLSGGRYDTLIGDFGLDMPAVGFGVDVGSLLCGNVSEKPADVIVFAEDMAISRGIAECGGLIAEGRRAEFSLFSTLEETLSYAVKKGIKKLVKVTENDITEIETEAGK